MASVTALAVISAGVAFLSTTAAVQWLFKDKLVKKKRSGLQPTSDISGSKSVMLPNVTTTWIEGSCVYRVCFAELPFAKGVCKVSYEGWIVGDGPRTGCRVVVKTVPTDARTDARRWMPDRALADLAATFVHAFSKATDAAGIQHRSIDVVIPRIAQVAGGLLTVGQYVMIEPYLEGEFIKFNSNGGWEDKREWTMSALTHFSSIHSRGDYILSDLQGTKTGRYCVTDPAIHSRSHLFRRAGTDGGRGGIQMVLNGHKCNPVCKALRLPQIKQRKTVAPIKTSIYSFAKPKRASNVAVSKW